jgi:hypothetical protein
MMMYPWREVREQGTFRFAEDALPYAEANAVGESHQI